MDELSADSRPQPPSSQQCLECYVRSLLVCRGIDTCNILDTNLAKEDWSRWAIELMDRILRKELFWVVSKCIDTWGVMFDLTSAELDCLTQLNSRNFGLSADTVRAMCPNHTNTPH